jgi:hypothetical protein
MATITTKDGVEIFYKDWPEAKEIGPAISAFFRYSAQEVGLELKEREPMSLPTPRSAGFTDYSAQ